MIWYDVFGHTQRQGLPSHSLGGAMRFLTFTVFFIATFACSVQPADASTKPAPASTEPQPAPAQAPESGDKTSPSDSALIDPEADCFTGELIIGEGDHTGEIEFVGCDESNARSMLLVRAQDGKYRYPEVQGNPLPDWRDIYFTLGNKPAAALIFHAIEHGEVVIEGPLHEVWDWTYAVKKGKLTPLIAPDILPPLEVVSRKVGKIVGDGYVWTMSTKGEQLGQ